jgi:hypothetical protein
VKTGEPISPLFAKEEIGTVVFNGDGSRLLTIRHETGEPISPLFAKEEIGTVVFNGDGSRQLTVPHEYATPRLWSLEDGDPKEIPVLREGEARSVGARSAGRLFLVEYPDHKVKFFSMDSGKEIGESIILPDLRSAPAAPWPSQQVVTKAPNCGR